MGFWRKIKDFVKIMRRPDCLIGLVCALYSLFRLWNGVKGVSDIRPASSPGPFIKNGYVHDLYSGNLVYLDILLQYYDVSFVLYYAPWDQKSVKAAGQFVRVARRMHKDVSFIAINCWWYGGACRRAKSKKMRYPALFVFHKNKKTSVQYHGPHLWMYYEKFLKKVLRPITYLGTSSTADSFLRQSQVSVIYYADLRGSPWEFRRYFAIALETLEKYPKITLQFGVVLSNHLSSELGLKRNIYYLYDRTFSEIQPYSQLVVGKNVTDEFVIKWATKRTMALKKIFSVDQKSNALFKILEKGPTMISFITNFDHIKIMDEVAIRYHMRENCCRKCCRSFVLPSTVSICLKSSLSLDSNHSCSLFEAMLEQLWKDKRPDFIPSRGGCGEWNPLYDPNRNRLEVCISPYLKSRNSGLEKFKHVAIDGLSHVTNMTLRFLVMDYKLTPGFADALGFVGHSLPFTAILDLRKEQKYIMKTAFSTTNMENLILDYTHRFLTPDHENPLSDHHQDLSQQVDHVSVPHVHPQNFEKNVLNSSKDVLLYYHATWCGACMACSHTLLSLKAIADMRQLSIYQVDDRTNDRLPHAFKALSYPTMILFPSNRSSDSVVLFSSCTLPHLVDFLLNYASTAVKAQLLLGLCSQHSGYGSLVDICKQRRKIERLAT